MKPSSTSRSFHGMPAYSGITTRTSMPERAQRLGQRARDVGQPAGLRERRALGRDEQNLQRRRWHEAQSGADTAQLA